MMARIVYQAPSTAICWSVYEFFKYFLSRPDVVGGSGGGGGGGGGVSGGGGNGGVVYEKLPSGVDDAKAAM